MKKILPLLISLLIIGNIFINFRNEPENLNSTNKREVEKPIITQQSNKTQSSLFVPYWSLSANNSDFKEYDQLLYFGVTPLKNGEINKEDVGYKSLSTFVGLVNNKQDSALVLRMLNSTNNFAILKDEKAQNKLISESIDIVKVYEFEGIVLNLELSALPFDSLIQQINKFNEKLFKEAKLNNLTYAITIYGDTYYRVRPFDVKTLAKNTDQVMIMAYDMSKAGGNPGPNFPLKGKDKYGYDYSLLIDKLLKEVPIEKVSIIFGLYGYDWQVDENNIAQKSGKPLSFLQIQYNILNRCSELACSLTRDVISQESMITYKALDGTKHTVWYEDLKSVSAKRNFLQTKGINNFSFWAYSYF